MSDKSNVKLNIRSPALKGLEVTRSNKSLRDAVEKKMLYKETFDEAWERILSMKNSNPDELRLKEVKKAMEKGEIGRDPDSTNKRFSKAEALRMHAKLAEIKREGVLKELVDNTPDNYVLVDSRLKIAEMNSDIKKSELIAFDIETFGEKKEDALDPYEGKIAGFSVTANGNNYYVPLNHTENPLNMTDNEIIDDVKDVLEDARTVMHKAPFDCKWMYLHYKVDMIANLHADTRIMATALDENRSHRLKDLLTDWMRQPSDNFDELFPETNKFNEIPLDVALVYAAGDTEKTLRLYKWIKSKVKPYKLERIWQLLFDIEMPVARTFIWSDLRGIKFDVERSKELDEYYAKEQRELERKIFKHFGEKINLNSPAQKSKMLFDKIRLTDLSGNKSTAQKFLKRIENEHEVVSLLLEHSELGKLRSSFTKKLPNNVKKDGMIHPEHNTWGAKTGRFTCRNPNTQQIPASHDEVRKLFQARNERRMLVAMDYSQIELRILAHLANDNVLIDAFNEGKDIHSTTASMISGIPYERIQKYKDDNGTPESIARNQAKTVNFGIFYGMTEKTLSDNLRISEREAKKIIDDYFEGYPGIKRYMNEQHNLVRKKFYVTDMYGRKRRFHREMKSREFWLRSAAERQAGNFPIQSSAGTMLKHAIVKLQDVLPRHDVNIVLQVHDELIFDCPKDISKESLLEIKETMENVVELKVPVKADIDIYPERWAEVVDFDEWFKE